MTKNHILLVDGMALLFRGFYATASHKNYMINQKGIPTNGIFQFMRYFFHAIKHFQPTHVFCCWDMGQDTFRKELYTPYKANRKEPPEELIPQFSLIKKVMTIYGVPNVKLKNYEADDCIGTLSERFKQYHHITILSQDQDFYQLIDKNVQLAYMLRGQGNYRLYTAENFYQTLQITPEQVIDMKALMGDRADNYPGVRGIGEKRALQLIKTYGSIENLLNHLDDLTPALRQRIKNDMNMLHLFQDLATIKRNLPINISLKEAIFQYDQREVFERLDEFDLAHVIV